MLAVLIPALFLLAVTHVDPAIAQDRNAAGRARMVAEVAAMARETGEETGRPRFADAVMAAMGKVPRHRFVPLAQETFAYENRPLPIGENQTISQPYIVALMTDLLDPKPTDTVLEVGTGSGYQAAVLAELVTKVYSIEIVEPLAKRAIRVLGQLGYGNVETRVGDGFFGWPEVKGGFDIIIVTCAAQYVPPALIEQLKPGGRLIIPVGQPFKKGQVLYIYTKDTDGRVHSKKDVGVFFIPMTGAIEKQPVPEAGKAN